MKVKKVIREIIYWIYVLFLAYVIFELSRKIIGGSLGFEAILVVLLSANLAHSFALMTQISKINAKLSGHLGWHKGRRRK